jgi:hypothetical protein
MNRLETSPTTLAVGAAALMLSAGTLGFIAGQNVGGKATGSAPQTQRFEQQAQTSDGSTAGSAAQHSSKATHWAPPAEIAAAVRMVEHRSSADDIVWRPPEEIAPKK